MLDQSKSVFVRQLNGELKKLQAELSTTSNQQTVEKVAGQIVKTLTHPLVKEVVSYDQVEFTLNSTKKVQDLGFHTNRYEKEQAIRQLRKQLKILMESLPGDPDETDPDFPWDK